MALRFQIDTDRLTIGEWAELSSVYTLPDRLITIYSRFMLNGNGQYLPEAEAAEQIKALPYSQLKEIQDKFLEAWREAQSKAVPQTSTSSS